jgi:hypothetical protein
LPVGDTLKVNVSVRGGPTVLELSNDGGWQRTTREMKVKSNLLKVKESTDFMVGKEPEGCTWEIQKQVKTIRAVVVKQ